MVYGFVSLLSREAIGSIQHCREYKKQGMILISKKKLQWNSSTSRLYKWYLPRWGPRYFLNYVEIIRWNRLNICIYYWNISNTISCGHPNDAFIHFSFTFSQSKKCSVSLQLWYLAPHFLKQLMMLQDSFSFGRLVHFVTCTKIIKNDKEN